MKNEMEKQDNTSKKNLKNRKIGMKKSEKQNKKGRKYPNK